MHNHLLPELQFSEILHSSLAEGEHTAMIPGNDRDLDHYPLKNWLQPPKEMQGRSQLCAEGAQMPSDGEMMGVSCMGPNSHHTKVT